MKGLMSAADERLEEIEVETSLQTEMIGDAQSKSDSDQMRALWHTSSVDSNGLSCYVLLWPPSTAQHTHIWV